MWKELGLESVKKGLDKGMDFVKRVATDNLPRESSVAPRSSPGSEYVFYRIKFAPENIGENSQEIDNEESAFVVKTSAITVGEIKKYFPVFLDKKSAIFRFKLEDDLFDYVWLEHLADSASPPTYRGSVHMQVLLCHSGASKAPPVSNYHTPSGPSRGSNEVSAQFTSRSHEQPAPKPHVAAPPPDRAELVRQRQEAEASKVQAARDFAQQNADQEALRRQQKLDSQNALKGELDNWALTEQGKFKDVRSLLSTMQQVLWPNSGWEPVAMGELMMSEAAVKKCYRKAIILCHPDRHQQGSSDQQYRADRIFNAINEAHKVYYR